MGGERPLNGTRKIPEIDEKTDFCPIFDGGKRSPFEPGQRSPFGSRKDSAPQIGPSTLTSDGLGNVGGRGYSPSGPFAHLPVPPAARRLQNLFDLIFDAKFFLEEALDSDATILKYFEEKIATWGRLRVSAGEGRGIGG